MCLVEFGAAWPALRDCRRQTSSESHQCLPYTAFTVHNSFAHYLTCHSIVNKSGSVPLSGRAVSTETGYFPVVMFLLSIHKE